LHKTWVVGTGPGIGMMLGLALFNAKNKAK